MKQILMIVLLVASYCSTVFAQPVFTNADNPQAGDTFTYHSCNITSQGSTGANVTWDFSSAASTFTYGGKYDVCSSSADCATFPGSNIVLKYPSLNTEKFLILDSNRYAFNGLKLAAENRVYTKSFDYIRYPFHYGDTYTDSLVATFTYHSTPYLEKGYFTNTYDGWGTLKLPTGTFNNVLRMHQVEVYSDSDLSGTTITRDSIVQYTWQAAGYHEYLFSYSKTYKNGSLAYTTISYTNQLPLDVKKINSLLTDLLIYPNPVKDELNIKFCIGKNEKVHIGLYDMMGKELAIINNQILLAGQQYLHYTLPALPKGLYLLRLQTGGDESVCKKIEVW